MKKFSKIVPLHHAKEKNINISYSYNYAIWVVYFAMMGKSFSQKQQVVVIFLLYTLCRVNILV
jgi:hypothetical protein